MSATKPWWKLNASHYASHGSAIIQIGLISVLGILGSFGFQVVTARGLGPSDFGVLSAFFAIVSMAAIGSSSLQNAVAVQTARALAQKYVSDRKRRGIDGFTVEALILGGGGALIVVVGSPLIVSGLKTQLFVPLLAAISIILSFVFARAVGTIQGAGNSRAAVWWTSISLLVRLALVAAAFAAGLGLPGALESVLVASALVMLGAMFHSHRLHVRLEHVPFRLDGVVVILMSIAFAWVTNVDVILVRAHATHETSGLYGAAAMLVKAGFLIPGTLSLYLLPRFVRQEHNRAMTRLGVRLTLLVTAAGGALMIVIFAVLGGSIVRLLFGQEYQIDNLLLAGISLAYLPWIMAQGLLIRMNALSSKSAVAVLAGVAVAQWIVSSAVLPNITLLLVVMGVLGVVVLASFLIIDRLRSDRIAVDQNGPALPSTVPR